MQRGLTVADWRRIALYGAGLALGVFLLQWLDYRRLTVSRAGEIYLALIAAAFLALGVFVGARIGRPPSAAFFDGNPKAVETLGISPRELEVLRALSVGAANKEIARSLGVSPNTVKSHLARLYEKLEAKNRTDAVARARDLGLVR